MHNSDTSLNYRSHWFTAKCSETSVLLLCLSASLGFCHFTVPCWSYIVNDAREDVVTVYKVLEDINSCRCERNETQNVWKKLKKGKMSKSSQCKESILAVFGGILHHVSQTIRVIMSLLPVSWVWGSTWGGQLIPLLFWFHYLPSCKILIFLISLNTPLIFISYHLKN